MLRSFLTEWDIVPFVFAEPQTPPFLYKDRVLYYESPNQLGIVHNWLYAAKRILEVNASPWIMMCEDDIEFMQGCSRETRKLILDLEDDLPGFISPYCSKHNSAMFEKGNWHKPQMPGDMSWCGACCLLFPREHLNLIVNVHEANFKLAAQGPHSSAVHLDCAIGHVLTFCGKKLLTHSPTLVDHKGEISTTEVNNQEGQILGDARTPEFFQ
jgi:hypothetical protein